MTDEERAAAPVGPRDLLSDAAIDAEVERRHYRIKRGQFAVGAEGFRAGATWARHIIHIANQNQRGE